MEKVSKITLFNYLMIMVLLQIYTRISKTIIGNCKFAQYCHNNDNTVTNFYYLIENILKTTRQGCQAWRVGAYNRCSDSSCLIRLLTIATSTCSWVASTFVTSSYNIIRPSVLKLLIQFHSGVKFTLLTWMMKCMCI